MNELLNRVENIVAKGEIAHHTELSEKELRQY